MPKKPQLLYNRRNMRFLKYLFTSLLILSAAVFFRMRMEIPSRSTLEIPNFFGAAVDEEPEPTPLIHMLFIPWDRDQNYLDDEFAFDQGPYRQMVERFPQGQVILWTRTKTREFCLKYYPEIWEILETYSSRNIMKIDILRWLFVYHFGGAYWQYDSLMLGSINDLIPSQGKKVKLFAYKRHFFYNLENNLLHPLRKWELKIALSPLSLRMVQGISPVVFAAAEPKNPTIKNLINFLLDRLQKGVVQNDGDIIYLTGNQAVTEFYHYFAKFDDGIELVPVAATQKLININSKGRWRMNKRKT